MRTCWRPHARAPSPGRLCGGARAPPARAAASAAASSPPPARIALVHGASRGLGLELVRQLLLRPDHAVVATCHAPAAAAALRALAAAHPGRLRLVRLDAADEASIAAAAAEVAELHQHLNLLVNAAGVLHVPGALKPETSFAARLLGLIDGARLGDDGKFWAWDGSEIPW